MQPWKQIGRYGTVGLELVLSMGIGYWVGRWADGKLNTKFLALVGLLFGVAAGFRSLLRAAGEMQREADREAADEANTQAAEGPSPSSNAGPVNARGSKDGDAPS